MLNREVFVQLMTPICDYYKKANESTDKLYEIMKVYKPDIDWITIYDMFNNDELMNNMIKQISNLMEDTEDNISWWIFETECGTKEISKWWDKYENEYPCTNLEELYQFLIYGK